jgi:uncharacterized protein (DUF433 family)
MNYRGFIEIVPGKRSGKPCIKQTRITVYDVLGWLANDMSPQEIIADYPELKLMHIHASLAYAAKSEHHLLKVPMEFADIELFLRD